MNTSSPVIGRARCGISLLLSVLSSPSLARGAPTVRRRRGPAGGSAPAVERGGALRRSACRRARAWLAERCPSGAV
uniref:Uncharacterized protein n=1 Tax=Arundo donax TaxID=35708 RepID=A0A0A9F5T8_ARUDO